MIPKWDLFFGGHKRITINILVQGETWAEYADNAKLRMNQYKELKKYENENTIDAKKR